MLTCAAADHSPADEIANDISVAYDDLIAVFRLVDISTVHVLTESRLDASAVLKNLQTFVTVVTQQKHSVVNMYGFNTIKMLKSFFTN